MTKDEALKLALEALELEDMACRYEKDQTPEHITKAIIAIKESLSQQNKFNPDWDAMAVMVEEQQRMAKRIAELEAQQEPAATVAEVHMSRYTIEWTNGPLPEGTLLYTTPPHRKPLTDEEIGRIAGDCLDAWSCARAIEAAHGIKE